MKYILVTAINTDSLESRVNSRLADGYKLQGGVSVTLQDLGADSRGVFHYAQAMVKGT